MNKTTDVKLKKKKKKRRKEKEKKFSEQKRALGNVKGEKFF